MGIASWILGGDDVKEKIVDGVYKGVDNMVYTEQEKKANHALFLKLYEPFKVAQRYLSLIFSVPFATIHTGIITLRVANWEDPVFQSAMKGIQGDLNESLGLLVLAIVGFYFAGGTIEGGVKAYAKTKT